jgi:tripartite ATP-independent transporter DctP family solute receptor
MAKEKLVSMSQKKRNVCVILISLAFAITVLGLPRQVVAKSTRIVAAHVSPVDSPYRPGFERFKEIIEKETKGAIKVSIHPAGELGGNEDILVQKMHTGTVDVIITSPGFLAQTVKEADLFSLLYLFKDFGHWVRVVDGSPGRGMRKIIEGKTSFKVLGYWSCGVRHYFGNKPVRTPADLKDVKIRVHTSPIIRDTWIALGAQPTNVAFSELYQALQNKVVDAAENSSTYIYKMKFYEVSPYISLTSHDFGVRFLLMSERKFSKLTDLQKLILEKAAHEATTVEREADYLSMMEDMDTLKKLGNKINEVDIESFVKLTAPIWKKAVKKLGLGAMLSQIEKLK